MVPASADGSSTTRPSQVSTIPPWKAGLAVAADPPSAGPRRRVQTPFRCRFSRHAGGLEKWSRRRISGPFRTRLPWTSRLWRRRATTRTVNLADRRPRALLARQDTYPSSRREARKGVFFGRSARRRRAYGPRTCAWTAARAVTASGNHQPSAGRTRGDASIGEMRRLSPSSWGSCSRLVRPRQIYLWG